MTVQELIENLKTWPPNIQVRRADSETEDETIEHIDFQPTRDPFTMGYLLLR